MVIGSALIEAVTALEVAVARFSKSAKLDGIVGVNQIKRIDAGAFASQVKHLGLTATIRYLLPLLFKEEVMSENLLKDCQDAITMRGNVVHEGQRDVNEDKLSTMLPSVRQMCGILSQFSE